jgi:hypothetical protein
MRHSLLCVLILDVIGTLKDRICISTRTQLRDRDNLVAGAKYIEQEDGQTRIPHCALP